MITTVEKLRKMDKHLSAQIQIMATLETLCNMPETHTAITVETLCNMGRDRDRDRRKARALVAVVEKLRNMGRGTEIAIAGLRLRHMDTDPITVVEKLRSMDTDP